MEANKQKSPALGVFIKCQRCGHQWQYRGKNPFFTICTFCRTSVSIRKNRVKPAQSNQVWTLERTAPVAFRHQELSKTEDWYRRLTIKTFRKPSNYQEGVRNIQFENNCDWWRNSWASKDWREYHFGTIGNGWWHRYENQGRKFRELMILSIQIMNSRLILTNSLCLSGTNDHV